MEGSASWGGDGSGLDSYQQDPLTDQIELVIMRQSQRGETGYRQREGNQCATNELALIRVSVVENLVSEELGLW
jgi:hypothetical protein